MSAVFLAFANSSENRLPTLSMEDDQVYATLAQRQVQQHFTVHRDSFATIRKIADYLILYRDFLSVFLFSGHAGRDALFLEAETANAEGVAHLLGQCPNLKLVILNGCSTAAQVQRLIELPNHPVVIATSAEVNDFAATQFSIAFFQTLSAQFDTIEKAFEAGLGAAKMSASKEIRAGRKEINTEKNNEPLWGLYYAPAGEHNLQWKLPSVFNRLSDSYKSNELLIRTLIDSLESEDVKKIRTKEANNEDIDDLDKRDAILQSLPNPVSEQLSNLFAPRQGGSDAKFYNEPGLDRLEQLTATYGTIIELISFVMLSQLWDALQDKKDLNIEEDQRQLLNSFFQLRYDERLTYNFFPLIKTVREIFDQNEIPYFVKELGEVSKAFYEQSDFYNACFFMETLKRRFAQRMQIEQQEAAQLCVLAEEKLALILKQASFMALYKMSSIKDIDVLKYRHSDKITYRHQVVELVQRLGGLGDKEKKKEYLLDRSSVVMYRQDRENEFLNLSPFVIDENAFVKSATVSNLFFFERYEKAADVYCFKQIHKPDKMKLMIGNQENFAIVKEQFEALADLLFHQPMKAL